MNRRDFLTAATAPVALATISSVGSPAPVVAQASLGRLNKQGIAGRGLLGPNLSLEDQCRQARELGITGFEFSMPNEWPTMKKYGIVCSMYRPNDPMAPAGARAGTGRPGWNQIGTPEAMGEFLKAFHEGIDLAASNGVPNMILLAGSSSPTLSREQGADHTVAFCNAVKAHAEDRGVTLCMEYINSKGIQGGLLGLFDRMAWGVDVITRVNSPRVKILYDIFHAQIMEGFIVQTIRDNFKHIGHFHTGGVPGRHELDETQELNYRFIAQAIADLGYQGFVTHEWGATQGKDPVEMLKKSMSIINV